MERSEYIGSSDAKDILSGDWDKLYRVKKGLMPALDLSDNFKAQLGVHTEPFHLDWTVKALNEERGSAFKWSKGKKNGEQHFATLVPQGTANKPVLGSTPDSLLKSDGLIYPVEVKHTGRFRSADEAADFYMPQIQHHLICWGVELLLFSVICGTEEPERIWIGYSEEWAHHYIERCDEFWRHIVRGKAPPPVFYDGAKKAAPIVPTKVADSVPMNGMKRRSLEGNNRAMALVDEFITTKEAVASHEKAKKELKEMVAADESELYCDRLTMKRNKAGSILFKIIEQKEAA